MDGDSRPALAAPEGDPAQIKTICVIGAGAAGLAALKSILDTPQFRSGLWKPLAFEARDNAGGVWLPDTPTPSDSPPPDLPPTPLYDSLTTNLPHPVMCFTAFPLPPATAVFPPAAHVQRYLESYAAHFNLLPFVRLNTLVTDVRRQTNKWTVRLSSGEALDFDLVIVANGHHRIPRYPDVPGVDKWLTAKRASHSVWYRRAHHLGDKILVVGGGPSGTDIAAEMRGVCTTLIRSVSGAPHEDSGNLKMRGRTTRFGDDGQVFFEDGSVETGIDHCILATGYQVSFPFLSDPIVRSGLPPPAPPLPGVLYNSTYHIFPLAQHIFPLQAGFPPTSLAFMGLPVRVAPLPIMEAQAAAIVHAFAHPDAFDVEAETRALGGDAAAVARAWSVFKGEEQFDYQDWLHEFAGSNVRVPQWRKNMYEAKGVLRSFWVELERRGEADEWVRGEWVDLLKRLLQAAEESKTWVITGN
ncbi:hypothetical protein B0H10DRAFT_2140153 [Mycena sp. CBHHK59/15]|nr:hypothetical protein B0H10DRAFT_2140153 [Mycena sp. CBHHK59/15]